MSKTELFKTRQETFLLLAAKYPKHEFGSIDRSAARHHRQNKSGEEGMIEVGHGPPSLPFGLLRRRHLVFSHFRSRRFNAFAFGREHSAPAMSHEMTL